MLSKPYCLQQTVFIMSDNKYNRTFDRYTCRALVNLNVRLDTSKKDVLVFSTRQKANQYVLDDDYMKPIEVTTSELAHICQCFDYGIAFPEMVFGPDK